MGQDNKGVAKAAQDTNDTPAVAMAAPQQQIVFTPEMLLSFAETIGKSVAEGIKATAPKRRKTIAEVPPASVFNPKGTWNRALKRSMFINGLPGETLIETLTDGEIECLDLLQPGRYLDGHLTVVDRWDGPNQKIYLWYANRTRAQQDKMNEYGLTFEARLRRALAEADAKMVPAATA